MKNTTNEKSRTGTNTTYYIKKQKDSYTVIQCGHCTRLIILSNHSSGKKQCPNCNSIFEWQPRSHSTTSSSIDQPQDFLQSFVNTFSNGSAKELRVAFTGPFSSGKSSLINWLLRTHCLPVFLTPTPCPPVRLTFSDKFSVSYSNENITLNNFEELRSHLKTLKLTDKPAICDVTAPIPLLRTGMELFDVTGSNSPHDSHYKAVEMFYQDFLKQMDFVYFVRRIGPLDTTDMELIQLIHDKSISYAIILTQADTLDSSHDIHAVVNNNRKSLESKGLNPNLLAITLNPMAEIFNSFENVFPVETFFSNLTSIMEAKRHIIEIRHHILKQIKEAEHRVVNIGHHVLKQINETTTQWPITECSKTNVEESEIVFKKTAKQCADELKSSEKFLSELPNSISFKLHKHLNIFINKLSNTDWLNPFLIHFRNQLKEKKTGRKDGKSYISSVIDSTIHLTVKNEISNLEPLIDDLETEINRQIADVFSGSIEPISAATLLAYLANGLQKEFKEIFATLTKELFVRYKRSGKLKRKIKKEIKSKYTELNTQLQNKMRENTLYSVLSELENLRTDWFKTKASTTLSKTKTIQSDFTKTLQQLQVYRQKLVNYIVSEITRENVVRTHFMGDQIITEYGGKKMTYLDKISTQRFTINLPPKNILMQKDERNRKKNEVFTEINSRRKRIGKTQEFKQKIQWNEFKQLRGYLAGTLSGLSRFLTGTDDLRSFAAISTPLHKELNKETFSIAVIGEMKRGKSTLLNTLLRFDEEVLSTNVNPETARLSKIRYSDKPEAVVYLQHKKQGLKIPFNQLKKYTSSVSGDPVLLEQTLYAEIGIPEDILKDGVIFVDTPGVNDPDEAREKITIDHLKEANAAVFLINHFGGLTGSEMEFLRERILSQNGISGIIFVFNQIDRLDHSPEEIKNMFDSTQSLLFEAISTMVPATRLEDIVLLPLSAKNAFDALNGNHIDPIYKEMFELFEKELYGTLIQNRGKHLLNRIVQKINSDVMSPVLAQVNTRLEILQQEDQASRIKKINELKSSLKNFKNKTEELLSDAKRSVVQNRKEFDFRYESIVENVVNTLSVESSDVQYIDGSISLNNRMQEKLKDKSVLLMTQIADIANSIAQKEISRIRHEYNEICRQFFDDFSPRKAKSISVDVPHFDLHIRASDISSQWESGVIGFLKDFFSAVSSLLFGSSSREERKLRELENKLQQSWTKEIANKQLKERMRNNIERVIYTEIEDAYANSKSLSQQFERNLENLSQINQSTEESIQQCKQLMAEINNFEHQLAYIYQKVNGL